VENIGKGVIFFIFVGRKLTTGCRSVSEFVFRYKLFGAWLMILLSKLVGVDVGGVGL
jgi:hypothetical protein